jgi:hypothetical protein
MFLATTLERTMLLGHGVNVAARLMAQSTGCPTEGPTFADRGLRFAPRRIFMAATPARRG